MALQLLIAKGKWRKLAKTNLNRSHTLTSHNQKNVHAWLNIWNRIHRKNSSLFFFFNKIVIKIAFTYIQQKKLSTRDYIMIHSRVFFLLVQAVFAILFANNIYEFLVVCTMNIFFLPVYNSLTEKKW